MRCFQQRCLQPTTNAFPVYGKRITLFALIAVKKIDKNYNLVFRPYSNKMRFCLLQTILRKTLQCRLHIVKGKQINKQIQNNTKKQQKTKACV